MHRSGTSLITGLLKQMGMHIGRDVQRDNEAIFFVNINDWILRERSGSWDRPEILENINNEIIEKSREEVRRRISSKDFKHYYDGEKENLSNLVWGWKDPRNSLNFELWNDLFPNAIYVHIYRNPIDVANSLRTRVQRSRSMKRKYKRWIEKIGNIKSELSMLKRVKHQSNQDALLQIQRGIELWKSYIISINEIKSKIDQSRFFEIKYEDFLFHPKEAFSTLIDFVGLDGDLKSSMLDSVDSSRAYAFNSSEELSKIYQKVKNDSLIASYGYDKIEY